MELLAQFCLGIVSVRPDASGPFSEMPHASSGLINGNPDPVFPAIGNLKLKNIITC
jgi:hypothetical protein